MSMLLVAAKVLTEMKDLMGAALASIVSLLLAPQSGRRTRRRLRRSVEGMRDTATDRIDDISDDLRDAVRTGRRRLSF
ncbi:MAG TPA: YtxH domain-containing protein [Longimicrobiales bacterium]|nr:YtxH domain-containing protein [Longimicrobiales bacterium]